MSQKTAAARAKVVSIIQAASPTNDWQKYERELLECFRDDSEFDGMYFALANFCRTHGKLRLAQKYLRRSLELQNAGFHGPNLILLGEILVEARRLEEAETAFEGALAHNLAAPVRDGVVRQLGAVRHSLVGTPDGGIKCQLRTEILSGPRNPHHDAAANALKLVKRCERSWRPDMLSVFVSEPHYAPVDGLSDRYSRSLVVGPQTVLGAILSLPRALLKWALASVIIASLLYLASKSTDPRPYWPWVLRAQLFVLAWILVKNLYAFLYSLTMRYSIRDGLLEIKHGVFSRSKEQIFELRHAEQFLLEKSLLQWLARRWSLYILIMDAFARPQHTIVIWGKPRELRTLRDELRGLATALRGCPFLRTGLVT